MSVVLYNYIWEDFNDYILMSQWIACLIIIFLYKWNNSKVQFVKEGRIIKVSVQNFAKAIPKDWTGEITISATTERESTMDRSGSKWCEGSSKHNDGWPGYFLLDKHPSSEKINDPQETNEIPIQTFKSTDNLDNSLREESYVSPHGVNNIFKINTSEPPSESEENFVWSINDRFCRNQTKDSRNPTEIRPRESAHTSTGCEWESVDEKGSLGLRQLCRNQRDTSAIPVEARCSNKDAYDFHGNTTNKVTMQELSSDDGSSQREESVLTLLNLLKNKYPFLDEMDKNILYDIEICRFAEFYNITDFCPVLVCDDLIFWLKDLNGVIYMWSRTDESMILGGRNMKEALINFLFCQKNLYYIEEYTHELISVKKVKEEVDKCYEEGKKTVIVVTDEILKPLKKGGKQKKRQKKKE
ncbi:hypothetical protein RclHR1_08920001 [Rhizophagus clarus]|uniref:Uncharacterized protein n=1 Tax=Rhizophagus clarus TaxID=94130 RepID=A0A2Z6S2N4_9GLOM|nr:hypothetical protein RclHR1_08920001 [Rhizophagus clarus]GES85507.1 hypothetical protein GLOIN_2v1838029 [Rhizophagus clarus]